MTDNGKKKRKRKHGRDWQKEKIMSKKGIRELEKKDERTTEEKEKKVKVENSDIMEKREEDINNGRERREEETKRLKRK